MNPPPTPPNPQAPRPRWGLDGAATVFEYPPGVRRVAVELIERLATAKALEGIPLIPSVDDSERRWRHRELPRLARELQLDGLLSFTSAFPVFGPARRVQLIHELPWRHSEPENAGRGHRLWARHGWRRAAAIVVPSERVLADLADDAPRAAEKAHVIPWGLSESFSAAPAPGDPARLERLGLAGRCFVLAAGATRPKKRVDLCLAALALLGKSAPTLVVTGPITEQLTHDLRHARTLGLEGKLLFLGHVSEPDLAALTRHARAALSLAASEGFGLGTLEALGSGTPTIVAHGSAQAEVAGSAGHAVPTDDPTRLATQLRELLDTPPKPADLLERARHFTWESSSTRLQELLVSTS